VDTLFEASDDSSRNGIDCALKNDAANFGSIDILRAYRMTPP